MVKKQHLLVLHNGSTRSGCDHVVARYQQAGFRVTNYWAANGEFPEQLEAFDGCYLSGSPHGAYDDIDWIHREHVLIEQMARRDMPMLGVCFGSQILASALCGRDQVFRRATCSVGYMHLPLTEAGKADPLTAPLANGVEMFVWHNDEVRASHADMVILASTTDCPNHIWRFRDRPIWGIQGHPELDRQTAIRLFDADRAVFVRDGADVEQLKAAASDTLAAKTLLDRFGSVVQAHR